jgi:Yip1 domain
MAFDWNKTVSVIKGGLLDPENTWKSFLAESPSWQQTATVLTGPLLVANVALTVVFSRMIGGYSAYGLQGSWFSALVLGLAAAAAAVAITAAVFNFFAGTFSGTPNFSRAFAGVSLAAIPSWVAGAIGAIIPFVGFLLALAGGILTLIYLYRIMPLALNVAQDKRIVHYVVSLLVIMVINFVIAITLNIGSATSQLQGTGYSDVGGSGTLVGAGVLAEVDRQGELMNAAGADSFEPPADGKLDEAQVEAYVTVLRKTRALQAEYAENLDKVAKDIKAKEKAGEEFSLADLGKAMSGAGSLMGANNAEMEVVKSGGGNWAEHEWIKQQLRTARIQQGDGDEAIVHNYKLYQQFEAQLKEGSGL